MPREADSEGCGGAGCRPAGHLLRLFSPMADFVLALLSLVVFAPFVQIAGPDGDFRSDELRPDCLFRGCASDLSLALSVAVWPSDERPPEGLSTTTPL